MNTNALCAILREHSLTRPMSQDQLERFASVGELEPYAEGEAIVTEGTLGDAIYLLLEGRAVVTKKEAGERVLARLEAGEFFGEMSLVEATARSATVTAIQASRVFRIPHTELQKLAEVDPQCMNRVLVVIVRTLSGRLRSMNEMLGSVAQLSEWLARSIV